jgi:ligand-binding sensor domain-containing protein
VRDIDVDGVSNVYVAADDGLWRWNGSNWTHFNNLSTDDLTALAVDRSSNPVTLYIGTGDEGIFISQDGGDTWTSFNDGLGALSITELVISSSQPKMLYAGTSYGGVWSLVLESAYFIYLPFALR